MSDYRLEFGSTVSVGDTCRLSDLLSIVSKDDELEISIDSRDIEQMNNIIDMLENNDFSVSAKKYRYGGRYHLYVHRIYM